MVNADLAAALQLPDDCDDEQVTSTIVNLLISAVHDSDPQRSLADIHHLITNFGGTSYLDPLNALPVLLPYDDPAARDILSVIGECGSAKEVVMAVQEAVERLQRTLEIEDEEDTNEGEDNEETKKAPEAGKQTIPMGQLLILVDLYASAIPRIKLRRKSAEDTLQPLFEELQKIIDTTSSIATKEESRNTIAGISRLSSNVLKWVACNVDPKEDSEACKILLRNLLDRSLRACYRGLHTGIAQRTLEECYPRLAFRSRSQSANEAGEQEIQGLLDEYTALAFPFDDFNRQASAVHLVFYAYHPAAHINLDQLLSFLLPSFISSIQTNTFLDESLAVLIRSLHAWQTSRPVTNLPHDITLPLCGLLPSLASAHPDPAIRHQTFRVLSLLLSTSEPRLKFQHLVEYTRDSEFPQMRVAAVGLLKEALLQSLSTPRRKDDPFCSPLFLRSFGPILFRLDPPDLFAGALSLKDFQEMAEPGRLVECLSLYYVLLRRDQENLTGIRDRDILKSIEHSLLTPLRSNIERWMSDPAISNSHLHDITPIVSLKIGLERVDTAQASLLV
ncbi:hypothetical protein BJ912DRAFT_967076 [Pholiota molesta]|nr:hypothetical protein BJ912DRAFT_967076 [Pholiota molesta]